MLQSSGSCHLRTLQHCQVAAGAAVSEDPSIADEMKAAFLSRRDLMIDGLSAITGLKVNRPMGAFYLFPDVSALFGKSNGDRTISTAEDFAMYLKKPTWYGGRGCLWNA